MRNSVLRFWGLRHRYCGKMGIGSIWKRAAELGVSQERPSEELLDSLTFEPSHSLSLRPDLFSGAINVGLV